MLINYIASFIIIILGLYVIMTKKEKIKIIKGLYLIYIAIAFFFISIGYKIGGSSSIFKGDLQEVNYIDAIPQILVLSCMIISSSILAVGVSLIVKIKDREEGK